MGNAADAKEYRRFKVYMAIGWLLSIVFVVAFSYMVTLITARMIYNATLDVKKTMLRENVESMISYIDVCADKYLKEDPEASKEELEREMVGIAHDKIYSEIHTDGAYMWVEKILNYDGGENYAVRLIHPNLTDTNGEATPLILMLDIDFFKQFNDTYGHELGDKVLKAFVEAVRENVSEKDAVIRWGGDEFLAVLYDVPLDAQPQLGDKILHSIRAISLPELPERSVSASMGFAYILESDKDIRDVIGRADEAVYEAKENGRNNWKIR